jgi:hypothetical protein
VSRDTQFGYVRTVARLEGVLSTHCRRPKGLSQGIRAVVEANVIQAGRLTSIRPRPSAYVTASSLERTLSFARMLFTLLRTVSTLMYNESAI